jgi:hypothetical protein
MSFIEDGLTNDAIIEVIKNIIKRKEEDDIKHLKDFDKYTKLKTEFELFETRYPMLFEMTTRDGKFDWDALNYFLMMRTRILEKKITSEEASIKVCK